jgi:hypothetical protein
MGLEILAVLRALSDVCNELMSLTHRNGWFSSGGVKLGYNWDHLQKNEAS